MYVYIYIYVKNPSVVVFGHIRFAAALYQACSFTALSLLSPWSSWSPWRQRQQLLMAYPHSVFCRRLHLIRNAKQSTRSLHDVPNSVGGALGTSRPVRKSIQRWYGAECGSVVGTVGIRGGHLAIGTRVLSAVIGALMHLAAGLTCTNIQENGSRSVRQASPMRMIATAATNNNCFRLFRWRTQTRLALHESMRD